MPSVKTDGGGADGGGAGGGEGSTAFSTKDSALRTALPMELERRSRKDMGRRIL
jgi:hypothetical protein